MKKYRQLTLEDRERIAILRAEGRSLRDIAAAIGKSHGTISRELRRNQVSPQGINYLPLQAQKTARNRKRSAGQRARLKNDEIRNYVHAKLKLGWSPEQIAGRLKIDHPDQSISHEAIYQYIYGCAMSLIKHLPRKHRKRYRKGYKRYVGFRIANRISIDERPAVINEREEFGHWETDSVVCQGRSAVLNVITERKSRYVQITKLNSKTSQLTRKAICHKLSPYPLLARQSITYDNGSETCEHEQTNARLGSCSYFCHPYHSWEKGTVENTIGLIRRYLPKGWDFGRISPQFISQIESALNNRPRKCLSFRTPKEVFNQYVGALAP